MKMSKSPEKYEKPKESNVSVSNSGKESCEGCGKEFVRLMMHIKQSKCFFNL